MCEILQEVWGKKHWKRKPTLQLHICCVEKQLSAIQRQG